MLLACCFFCLLFCFFIMMHVIFSNDLLKPSRQGVASTSVQLNSRNAGHFKLINTMTVVWQTLIGIVSRIMSSLLSVPKTEALLRCHKPLSACSFVRFCLYISRYIKYQSNTVTVSTSTLPGKKTFSFFKILLQFPQHDSFQ